MESILCIAGISFAFSVSLANAEVIARYYDENH